MLLYTNEQFLQKFARCTVYRGLIWCGNLFMNSKNTQGHAMEFRNFIFVNLFNRITAILKVWELLVSHATRSVLQHVDQCSFQDVTSSSVNLQLFVHLLVLSVTSLECDSRSSSNNVPEWDSCIRALFIWSRFAETGWEAGWFLYVLFKTHERAFNHI